MVIAVEQTVAKVGKLLGTNSLCVGASLGGAEPKSAIFRRFVRANNELHEQQREEEGEEEETRLEIARPLEVEARRPRASSAPGNSTPYSRTSFTMRRFPQTPANVPRGRARRFESKFRDNFTNFFLFLKKREVLEKFRGIIFGGNFFLFISRWNIFFFFFLRSKECRRWFECENSRTKRDMTILYL